MVISSGNDNLISLPFNTLKLRPSLSYKYLTCNNNNKTKYYSKNLQIQ